MTRHTALALVVVGVAGCASRHPALVDPRGEFSLAVVNHHWLDVTIYIVHDGESSRVGIATASSTETFVLSGRLLGSTRQIYLMGRAVGSSEVVRTEMLTVQPGQNVEWTLENSLRRSSVGVY